MSAKGLVLEATELLPERLASALRKAIVEGQLAAGSRLVESDLARQFGVSRVPLREAFRVLAGEGLVTIHPHRGAIISELSESELIELFAVRAMFEAHATESLAVTRQQAAIEELEVCVASMRHAVQKQDLGKYYQLAAAFHEIIVQRCGNSVVARQYNQIKCLLSRYQAAIAGVADLPSKSILEHDRIIKAIRTGDTNGAAKAARAHVEDQVARYQAAQKKALTSESGSTKPKPRAVKSSSGKLRAKA